jgi:glycosyltransferase involved in cell wall biosynthesis
MVMNFLKNWFRSKKQINVLLLIPDSSTTQFGGMGTQANGLINACKNINFIEYNPVEYNQLHFSQTINDSTFIQQIYNQSLNLPPIETLKNIDIVHSFDASTSIQGRALANMLHVPHIMTLQLSMSWLIRNFYSSNPDLVSTIELSCMEMADVCIHVSQEYLMKYGVLNQNSFYMPNGIDFDSWQSTTHEKVDLPGRPNAKKLCYIGRYAEMKNIPGITQSKIPDDIDLYFIGGPTGGQDEIFKMMHDFVENTPNAYYLGVKHGVDKINTLRSMDAVIVPSLHEPFGIVCLEALASGCILLSSFKSGMGEYLTEDVAINCGITPTEITAGIKTWLSLSESKTQTRRYKGYELCKRYSWNNSALILENIYTSVLKSF